MKLNEISSNIDVFKEKKFLNYSLDSLINIAKHIIMSDKSKYEGKKSINIITNNNNIVD